MEIIKEKQFHKIFDDYIKKIIKNQTYEKVLTLISNYSDANCELSLMTLAAFAYAGIVHSFHSGCTWINYTL